MEANTRATAAGSRGRYHHGDLRNALVQAAIELAREGGPDAVVLRAAARKVGVSATAAYRHFAGQADLVGAVKEYGQQRLVARMEESGRDVPAEGPGSGLDRVRALGRGYVRFAVEEPGLFRSAFCHHPDAGPGRVDEGEAGEGDPLDGAAGTRSFQLMTETLDGLVADGVMRPEARPGAELSAWAMVHGLATLFLDGPLGRLPAEQAGQVVDRALDDIVKAFTAA